jgi:UPF0755 protein
MSSSRSVAPRRPRPVIEQRTYVAPHYHSRIWSRLLFFVLLLALVAVIGGGGGLYWSINKPQADSSKKFGVHVSGGDTVTSIANRLQRKGYIDNSLVFRLDARLHKLSSTLKAGDYTLRRNMSIDQMVGALAIYHARTISITVPEGWRAEQIAARLQRFGINGNDFLRAIHHPDRQVLSLPILRDKPRWAGLQGYLLPNTYYVSPHASGRDFADLMVSTLNKQFTAGMRQDAQRQHRSVYSILTLASIVEREARASSERGKIASVYFNRLRQHMGLYADPTVQFAVGTSRNWWPQLRATGGQVAPNSPYNTYTHGGLPPGPICNPGIASVRAALDPAHTNYLYFVAMGNGRHAFARTYAEHLRNVAKYEH